MIARVRAWWRRWFVPPHICWWCSRNNHKHDGGRCVAHACQCEVNR